MSRRTSSFVSAGLLLLTVAGCVHEEVNGATHTYTYELWVSAVILLGGIVAAVAGFMLRQAGRWSWALLIGGPIAALFFAPSLFLDHTVLDDQRIKMTGGIWGMTADHDVAFADLAQVRLTAEERRGRRGRRVISYYMVCERKDGTSAKLPLGNNCMEAAAPLFLDKVQEMGIPVVDETGAAGEG